MQLLTNASPAKIAKPIKQRGVFWYCISFGEMEEEIFIRGYTGNTYRHSCEEGRQPAKKGAKY